MKGTIVMKYFRTQSMTIIGCLLLLFALMSCEAFDNLVEPQPDENRTVYVTKTGSCYHRSSCSCLSKSKIAISLKEAKAQGYRACSRCKP